MSAMTRAQSFVLFPASPLKYSKWRRLARASMGTLEPFHPARPRQPKHGRAEKRRFPTIYSATITRLHCQRRGYYAYPDLQIQHSIHSRRIRRNTGSSSSSWRLFSSHHHDDDAVPSETTDNQPRGDDDDGDKNRKNSQLRRLQASKSRDSVINLPQTVLRAMEKDIVPHALQQQQQQKDKDETTEHPNTIFLIVGVSGGCDSVALLHSLMEIMEACQATLPTERHWQQWQFISDQEPETKLATSDAHRPPLELHVVHFDHQQRGSDSDGDRQLVRDLCETYGLPFHCYYWNNNKNPNRNESDNPVDEVNSPHRRHDTKVFSQDVARQWRRREMEALLQRLVNGRRNGSASDSIPPPATGIILTAHHRDDSMETLLLKLLRGTHVTNLQGMQPIIRAHQQQQQQQHDETQTSMINGTTVNDDTTNVSRIWYARPLLTVSKDDIVRYLQERGYEWREDSSNRSSKYLRNRVRNELVPLLSDLVVGGKDVLYKRLDNLEAQTLELQQDLEARSSEYHRETLQDNASRRSQQFAIPETGILQLHHKHAFFQWALQTSSIPQTNRRLHMSYEQMERVCEKVNQEPSNLQWQLSVGDEWNVQRQGSVLRLVSITSGREKEAELDSAAHNCFPKELQKLQWVKAEESKKDVSGPFDRSIHVSVPRQHLTENAEFWLGPVRTIEKHLLSENETDGNQKLTFSAPWWNEDRRPTKVSSFLRGQKVPLHQREEALTIVIRTRDNNLGVDRSPFRIRIVALFVEPKQEWMVDKAFSPDSGNAKNSIELSIPT